MCTARGGVLRELGLDFPRFCTFSLAPGPPKILFPCKFLWGELGGTMGKCPVLLVWLPPLPLETLSVRGRGSADVWQS